ncbi:MAG: SGNH hydrolase domain-containing protein, partial [Cyanobium sp.]
SGLRTILPDLPTSILSVYQGACYPRIDSSCPIIKDGIAWAKANPSVDVVILSGYHNLVINNNRYHWDGIDIARQVPGALSSLEASLTRTVGALTDAGKSVVMVVDSHELMTLPEESIIPLTGVLRRPGSLDVSRDQVRKRNQPYYDMLNRIAKNNPRFHVFSSGDYFCSANTCHSDLQGRPLFQTRDHLTPFGSKVLAAQLKPLLLQLLPPSKGSHGEPSS